MSSNVKADYQAIIEMSHAYTVQQDCGMQWVSKQQAGRVPRMDLDSLSSWMQTCWGCTPFSSLSGSGMLARALARGDRPFTLGAGVSRVGAVISLVSRRCSDTLSHLHSHTT